MNKKQVTYEESVRWMRNQPEFSELVKLCYLDEDNLIAAKRFFSSEEFSEVAQVLKLDKRGNKLKILDVGCGNGIASYAFAAKGHDVYAVDPDLSEDVGIGATQRLGKLITKGSISTIQAFAESLPFPDSTFDIVYARQSLHHFTDLQKGIDECSRVLKPRGVFLASREHVVDDEQQLKIFLENHLLHQLHGGENAYPQQDYILVLEKAGFQIVKCFAPFDTVINHFPVSNTEFKNWLVQGLEKKLGKVAASILSKFSWMEKLYRYRFSHSCNSPGRLYSFVCVKKDRK